LKNRMPTKALEGGTPLKAATGQKPNLHQACIWGLHVWVCIEGGTKLGGCIAEGCWMGVDNDSSNRCHVYWSEKCLVTVEWNMYWVLKY
ncbi:hypothetical protein PISMIDRAFT_119249, partial [Pisolithus microcarpus 441]